MSTMHSVSHISLLTPLLADSPDLSVLQNPRGWAAIKENAGRYGVAALVAHTVRPHVSRDDLAWCDRVLAESWARHELILRQLEHVLGILASEGIPAISLKGPLLAQRYYEPAFLRKPSGDLDLAIAGKDLERACEALSKAGYTRDMSIAQAGALSHHVVLSHPSRRRLELHFRLSHMTLGIPVDQFFERTIFRRLPGGHEARVLGASDQLLHLVLHFATARFGTLLHLYEIRRAFRAEESGARTEAIQRAIDHHFCGALRMTDIAFCAILGEHLIPDHVSVPPTWLNWRLNKKLYRNFERWSLPDRKLTLAARLWGRWLELQITDSPFEAFRFLRLFARTARFRMSGRDWETNKKLTYSPPFTVR